MQIGDLVKHIRIKHSRQVGVITKEKNFVGNSHSLKHQKYKVLWIKEQKEEYWFSLLEVEALCK